MPSTSLFGVVANYYRRSLQYSIVQKLFVGRYFPNTPAFQRSLWKCIPPVSFLSGSVPSRSLFGAVPNYYRRSLQYSIVQKLLLGRSLSHTPAFQRSLWKYVPYEFSLRFGAIKVSFWRYSELLPDIFPVFFAKAIVGTVSTPYATFHKISRGFFITELSLRPIVDCCLCNSFDAHAGWVRDRRGARSLNILFCRLPMFDVDKQLDVWDVWAKTWG